MLANEIIKQSFIVRLNLTFSSHQCKVTFIAFVSYALCHGKWKICVDIFKVQNKGEKDKWLSMSCITSQWLVEGAEIPVDVTECHWFVKDKI